MIIGGCVIADTCWMAFRIALWSMQCLWPLNIELGCTKLSMNYGKVSYVKLLHSLDDDCVLHIHKFWSSVCYMTFASCDFLFFTFDSSYIVISLYVGSFWIYYVLFLLDQRGRELENELIKEISFSSIKGMCGWERIWKAINVTSISKCCSVLLICILDQYFCSELVFLTMEVIWVQGNGWLHTVPPVVAHVSCHV